MGKGISGQSPWEWTCSSVTVPAAVDQLEDILQSLHKGLRARGCPESVLGQIDIALEELFVNICSYAYAKPGEEGQVCIEYAFDPEDTQAVTVRLIDEGIPFDSFARDDPPRPSRIEEAKVGGWGIYMVKRMMDEFGYHRDGSSNVVTFKKHW